MADLASIITAVATAVGTPGLTYLVMNKMQKVQITKIQELHNLQITHMQESCKNCRKGLEEKIGDLDKDLGEVETRQRVLREKELPDGYIRRRECERCQGDLKKEVEVAHKRISEYHPKTGTGGP